MSMGREFTRGFEPKSAMGGSRFGRRRESESKKQMPREKLPTVAVPEAYALPGHGVSGESSN